MNEARALRFVETIVGLRPQGERLPTKTELYIGYLTLVEQLPMVDVAKSACVSRASADNHLLELARRAGCEDTQALRRRLSHLLWDHTT